MNIFFYDKLRFFLGLVFVFQVFFGGAQIVLHPSAITQYNPYLKDRDCHVIRRELEYSMSINSSDSTLVKEIIICSDSSFFTIFQEMINDEELLSIDTNYYEKPDKYIYSYRLNCLKKNTVSGLFFQYDTNETPVSGFMIVENMIAKNINYRNIYDNQKRLLRRIEQDAQYQNIIQTAFFSYDTLGYSKIESIPTRGIVYYYSNEKLVKVEKTNLIGNIDVFINTYDSSGRLIIEEPYERGHSYKQKLYTYDDDLVISITNVYENGYECIEKFNYKYNSLGDIVEKTKTTFCDNILTTKNITYYYY